MTEPYETDELELGARLEELGTTDELLGFELDDEATAELELGTWQTATIEPPINRQPSIVVSMQPIGDWHE